MAHWTDLATWRGPTDNCGDGDQYPNEGDDRMREQRGLVIHIAEGYFEGTIAYQLNPASNVSSHFVVSDGVKGQGRDGELAQIVDTGITAWTQRAGNGHWLSVECAGFTPHPLTAAQCESIAQLFARTHREYGVPLQLATNPDGKGLGHHSMGCNWPAGAWGHCDCPGPAIIAQKPAILARAIEIVNGDDMTTAAEFLAILRDPAVTAQMRAFPWQYAGGGLPNGASSTLAALTQIHIATAGMLPALTAKLDEILKAAEDDGNATVVLPPEGIAALTELKTLIEAVPTAEENADAVIAEIVS